MDPASYAVRYVAFVDILGFRELIRKLNDGGTELEALRALLTKIHKPQRGPKVIFERADFRAQSISDAVALSATLTPEGILHLFYSLEALAEDLLLKGFLIRGAIVKGRVYHDNEMIFGEGLIEAYRLEREVVKFPRVMIKKDVADDIAEYTKETAWRANFNDRLKQADDGPIFLNVLRGVSWWIRNELENSERASATTDPVLALYAEMGRQIQRRFGEAIDNPKHFEKVRWFAAYWNRTIPTGVKEIERVAGPGLDIDRRFSS